MKVKTSELEGVALDWAVSEAVNHGAVLFHGRLINPCKRPSYRHNGWWQPSTDWSQGGPLLEKYGVTIIQQGAFWCGDLVGGECQYSESPLVAACRAIVCAFLGNEVEPPETLVAQ